MNSYVSQRKLNVLPRIPLAGSIDLTYACNNRCRHCWLVIPSKAPERKKELASDEWRRIFDQATAMGCREWSISGGEPMLRDDFDEVFDYITQRSVSYMLNTNGTLITPAIARLMKRKGSKMVALYGATADVHDYITRFPGSFEATLRGMAYLNEAGAGFTVQIVPMRHNFTQFDAMIELAKKYSNTWRTGAPWLWLRADGDENKNQEIRRQRLLPEQILQVDKPDFSFTGQAAVSSCYAPSKYLFSSCLQNRRDFHIDPYGQMSFCLYAKDPQFRYDLLSGSFADAWSSFIPSLENKIPANTEYDENCGSCEVKSDCAWCPVYAWLEHGRYSAPIAYLCDISAHKVTKRREWEQAHRRYYSCGDITFQIESDLPITDSTFQSKLKFFEVDGPGADTVKIRHHFSLPRLEKTAGEQDIYRKHPWAISRRGEAWIYRGILPNSNDLHRVAVFNADHTRARIYNKGDSVFRDGSCHSLTLFPTDQILLARLLADRNGCILHSGGVVLNDHGLLFLGHSEAGKSTMVTLLRENAHILCDDRIVVRRFRDFYRIYGTWSHGTVPDVSGRSAPLRAVFILEKAHNNQLIPLYDRAAIRRKLLACLIKPLVTADWWEKMLTLVEQMSREIQFYVVQFDKSGAIKPAIMELCQKEKLYV
ncbi:radical SAM protein [candidate division KSB1 bacterium]|nr:radical SAM protein [candidate division KSB1 bacterium]